MKNSKITKKKSKIRTVRYFLLHVSVMCMCVCACVCACVHVCVSPVSPGMAAVIDGTEVVYRDYVDISVAVATPKVSCA